MDTVIDRPPVRELIQLPFDQDVFLHKETQSRWFYDDDHLLQRDVDGENDWMAMAKYVGKTYAEVFFDAYNYALRVAQAKNV